jgi:hypothetical protein
VMAEMSRLKLNRRRPLPASAYSALIRHFALIRKSKSVWLPVRRLPLPAIGRVQDTMSSGPSRLLGRGMERVCWWTIGREPSGTLRNQLPTS